MYQLFPSLGNYELTYYEHGCTSFLMDFFFNSLEHRLKTTTSECVYFYKLSNCLPQRLHCLTFPPAVNESYVALHPHQNPGFPLFYQIRASSHCFSLEFSEGKWHWAFVYRLIYHWSRSLPFDWVKHSFLQEGNRGTEKLNSDLNIRISLGSAGGPESVFWPLHCVAFWSRLSASTPAYQCGSAVH